MPKITSIEPQKKNLRRFNIYLDGEFAFGADEDLVVDWRLVPDKVLDTSVVERLLFEAEVGKLMDRMYRFFNIRQRSEKEVREYFRIKNYESRIKGKEEISQLAISSLIETLKKKGLVNDLEFAKVWVQSRRRTKQKGIRAIKAELYQKGISKEIIEEVVSGQEDYSEEGLAEQALEKKMTHWKNLNPLEFRQKAYEFLTRRGFEYEVVKDVIEKLTKKR